MCERHEGTFDPHCLWCVLPEEAEDVEIITDCYRIESQADFTVDGEPRTLVHAVDGWKWG